MASMERGIPPETREYLKITSPSVPASELPPLYQNARRLIEQHLGTIRATEVVAGGLASHVYRVRGEKQKGIAKIMGGHFARLPHILIDPKAAEYEWEALQAMFELEKDTFPQPLAFDKAISMILMTDIIPNGKTLEQRLENRVVTSEEMVDVGRTVARIHNKLADFDGSFRDGHDEEDYKKGLQYRFGYQGNIVLDDVVRQLDHEPTQLILGDLSPKNIGQGQEGQVTMRDLKYFYRGNLMYVYGYLAGHILVHTLDDPTRSEAFVSSLLQGYRSEDVNLDTESMLLKRLTLGTVLYRLHNDIIPYNVDLSPEAKLQKSVVVFNLLEKEALSWADITQALSRPKKTQQLYN